MFQAMQSNFIDPDLVDASMKLMLYKGPHFYVINRFGDSQKVFIHFIMILFLFICQCYFTVIISYLI